MKPPKRIKKKVRRYMAVLSATGMEDREVARAGYYMRRKRAVVRAARNEG